jgi:hypothetical protein
MQGSSEMRSTVRLGSSRAITLIGAIAVLTLAILILNNIRISNYHAITWLTATHLQTAPAAQVSFSKLAFNSYNQYGIPIYNSALPSYPAILLPNETLSWGIPLESSSGDDVKSTHPRLIATNDHWRRLPAIILVDPYLAHWNESIFSKAAQLSAELPVAYNLDGGNGVLDTAREVQLRIKHWAYAFRLSNDTRWKDRIWDELLVASGNSTPYFGIDGDNWNVQ